MKNINKQIEKVQKNTIGYDLQIKCETNKYGYDNLALYLNDSRLCVLNSLSRFETKYILNRLNNVYIAKEKRVYKDSEYDVIVIREIDGYENESIVLSFSYDTKIMLMAILDARSVL